jgi:hypothetical protein
MPKSMTVAPPRRRADIRPNGGAPTSMSEGDARRMPYRK